MIVTVMNQQFAIGFEQKTECVTQFLCHPRVHIHLDSRISHKEYKLSDCIIRPYSITLRKSPLSHVEQVFQLPFHLHL
jgi:hypothetical protein